MAFPHYFWYVFSYQGYFTDLKKISMSPAIRAHIFLDQYPIPIGYALQWSNTFYFDTKWLQKALKRI